MAIEKELFLTKEEIYDKIVILNREWQLDRKKDLVTYIDDNSDIVVDGNITFDEALNKLIMEELEEEREKKLLN